MQIKRFLSATAAVAIIGFSPIVASGTPASATAATVSIGDVSIAEGDAGSVAVKVPIELSQPVTAKVVAKFRVTTAAGTVNRSVAFLAGQSAKATTVSVVGNTVDGPDQTGLVSLTSVTGAQIGHQTGTVQVTDDDEAGTAPEDPLTVSIGSATVFEGDGGAHYAYVPVTLSRPASTKVTVYVYTQCGTAIAGVDYQQPPSRTLSFAAGTRSKTLTFRIAADSSPESVDQFFQALTVRLGNVVVGTDEGAVTIIDNDDGSAPPPSNMERISVAPDGSDSVSLLNASGCSPGGIGSYGMLTSDDGALVMFSSDAVNLVPNAPTDGQFHDYVRDRTAGTTQTVSDFTGGAIDDTDGVMGLNGTGRYIIFYSQRAALLPPGVSGVQSFRFDRVTGSTVMVTWLPNGSTVANGAYAGSISDDGTRVVFSFQTGSGASTSAAIHVRDVPSATTLDVDSTQKWRGSIAGDGTTITYVSDRTDLVAGDTNNAQDVFVQTLATGAIERVNLTATGAQEQPDAIWPGLNASEPMISDDGRYVLIRSRAPNLAVHYSDYFVRDTVLDTTTRVDANATVPAEGGSLCFVNNGTLDGSGRRVAFRFDCEQSDGAERPSDFFGGYLVDVSTGTSTRFDVDATGAPGDGMHSLKNSVVSGDGHSVLFSSSSSNLVAGDENDAIDVFITHVT